MHRRAQIVLALVLFLAVLPFALADRDAENEPAPVPDGTLQVEPNHSTVGFEIPIAGGITRVTGKFTEFEIEVRNVAEGHEKWQVEATIRTASIDTGIDQRDQHLRTADFFDAGSHPTIAFRSERVERSGDGYVAVGTLQMHGVRKPLKLPFTVTGMEHDDDGQPRLVGIAAHTTLNRQDFGVGSGFQHTTMKNFLGDEVTVEIFCWVRTPREKKAE